MFFNIKMALAKDSGLDRSQRIIFSLLEYNSLIPGVSAVIIGIFIALPSNTLFGMTRTVFIESPKIPKPISN